MKFIWRRDGSIHMTLGGKVDDRPRMEPVQQLCHKLTVTDITLYKNVARVFGQWLQILQVASVGQFVQVDNGIFAGLKPGVYEIGPDKSGPSGNQNRRR
jgi:hypothetical protein